MDFQNYRNTHDPQTASDVQDDIDDKVICGDLADDCLELTVCLPDAGTPVADDDRLCGDTDEVLFSVDNANKGDKYTYWWLVTDGAPNYTVQYFEQGFGADCKATIDGTELEEGVYCVHGFQFDGTVADFAAAVDLLDDDGSVTGVEVLDALANDIICGDLIVGRLH